MLTTITCWKSGSNRWHTIHTKAVATAGTRYKRPLAHDTTHTMQELWNPLLQQRYWHTVQKRFQPLRLVRAHTLNKHESNTYIYFF
jgi:hypothetical protein